MPGTGAALVVLHLGGKHRPPRGWAPWWRPRARVAAATGFALVRHGGRSRRGPSPAGSKASPTSVCIISWDVAGDLAAGPGDDGEHGGPASAMRFAMGVPGAPPAAAGSVLAPALPPPPIPCRRGPRACRRRHRTAAPASSPRSRRKRLRERWQGGRIFRKLQSERHRQRVLQPGWRATTAVVAMLPGLSGEARHRPREIAVKRVDPGRGASASWRCRSRPWLVAPQCT